MKIELRHNANRIQNGFAVLIPDDLRQIDSILDYMEHIGYGDLVLRIRDHEWKYTDIQISVRRDKS